RSAVLSLSRKEKLPMPNTRVRASTASACPASARGSSRALTRLARTRTSVRKPARWRASFTARRSFRRKPVRVRGAFTVTSDVGRMVTKRLSMCCSGFSLMSAASLGSVGGTAVIRAGDAAAAEHVQLRFLRAELLQCGQEHFRGLRPGETVLRVNDEKRHACHAELPAAPDVRPHFLCKVGSRQQAADGVLGQAGLQAEPDEHFGGGHV